MYSYVNPMFYEESPTKGQEISKAIFLGIPLPGLSIAQMRPTFLPKSDCRTFVLPVNQNMKKCGKLTHMDTNLIRE